MENSKASKVYDYCYSHATPRTVYGAFPRRDVQFVNFILEHVAAPSRILDAGCGRGHLMRWLTGLGYDVFGTEIAECLFRPGGELFGMPVVRMYYSELGLIADDIYDVVCSNDVIEHVEDKDAAARAMKDLARIAKDYVLLSTGGRKASRCPFPAELGISNLHSVIMPEEDWVELFSSFCTLIDQRDLAGSLFLFGKPH